MSSRTKTWSLTALAVLFLAGLITYVNHHQPRTHANYALYTDTGFSRLSDHIGSAWGYGEKPGHQTLAIARGEDYSHVYSDMWHHEKLSIEFDAPLTVGRTDLATGRARLGYWLTAWRTFNTGIEKQGVRGWIDIESVGPTAVTASYDITLTVSGPIVRDVHFRGRSTFQSQPRPDSNRASDYANLYPQ